MFKRKVIRLEDKIYAVNLYLDGKEESAWYCSYV